MRQLLFITQDLREEKAGAMRTATIHTQELWRKNKNIWAQFDETKKKIMKSLGPKINSSYDLKMLS